MNPSGTHQKRLQDSYVLSKSIGTGVDAVIRKCRHKFSNNFYACKVIEISKENADEHLRVIKNEINIIRKLKHSNILKFVDVFYTENRASIITELSEFGDLHDFMLNYENIEEPLARSFALDIASAVNYLHSFNVIHRDIKPENCLLFKEKPNENHIVKLCDFGLAEIVPSVGLKEICGSPSYVAPEILQKKNYGLRADVWSMGILFFVLLCRCYPFSNNDYSDKFDTVMFSNLNFSALEWTTISPSAKDLLQKMLVKNPKERISSSEVLYDKWFTSALTLVLNKCKPSFKAVSIAIVTTKLLDKDARKLPPRENAVLSKEIKFVNVK